MRRRAFSIGACVKERYQLRRRIGSGGMGDVFEVLDKATRRSRALKVMHLHAIHEPDLRARFEQEATITADIKSEHIVEVIDAGVDDGTHTPFIVMELLEGRDLRKVLTERKRFAPAEVLGILGQVARALRKTHARGIIHRDLKPANLFEVPREDQPPLIKVLDFGVAKIRDDSGHTRTTLAVGTSEYMAPEQHRGDGRLGPAADLYALAHVAFTLLVGVPYWRPEAEKNKAVLLTALHEEGWEPASIRALRHGVELGPALDTWFAKATARRPEDRFASAYDLVQALGAALDVPLPRAALPTQMEVLAEPVPSIGPPAPSAAPTVIEMDGGPSGLAAGSAVADRPAGARPVSAHGPATPIVESKLLAERPARSRGSLVMLACFCAVPGVIALGAWLFGLRSPSVALAPTPTESATSSVLHADPGPSSPIVPSIPSGVALFALPDPAPSASPASPHASPSTTTHPGFPPARSVGPSSRTGPPAAPSRVAGPTPTASASPTAGVPPPVAPRGAQTALPAGGTDVSAQKKGKSSNDYGWGQ